MDVHGRTGTPQLPTKGGMRGDLLVMFDVIYPTAPRVPLNGPLDIDGVLLSIGLHECVRKLLSASE